MPFFSIIIPSYKDSRILETINSITSQNFNTDSFEIVIQDGGSDKALLDEIASVLRTNDLLIVEKDDGIFDAINKGIENSSGKYIITLGSDDKFNDCNDLRFIKSQIKDNDFLIFGVYYTNKDWDIVRVWPPCKLSRLNYLIGRQNSHWGLVASKDVYKLIGKFNTKYKTAADFDFYLRLLIDGYRFKRETVHYFPISMKIGGNSSKNIRNIVSGNLEMLQALSKTLGVFYITHFLFKPFWKVRELINGKLKSNQ